MRLDKYLSSMGIGTRSEVKLYIRKGRVTVNGVIVKASDEKIKIEEDIVCFDNKKIVYSKYEYFMLNKPVNTISAVKDKHCTTVIDLIKDSVRTDLFPVGRLDKDTEGLLIITNDGELAHRLLSPRKHVPKIYYAQVEGIVNEKDIEAFKEGVYINEDIKTLPAELIILKQADISEVKLTIYEGKFHQVKKMFQAVDKEVVYLKRIAMGSLFLDENLKSGEYRELTKEEISQITFQNI